MTFDNFFFSFFPVCLSNNESETIKVAKTIFLAPGRLRDALSLRNHQCFAAMKLVCGFTRGNSGKPCLKLVMFSITSGCAKAGACDKFISL